MAPHTSNRKKDRLESGSRNTRRPSTGDHKHAQLAAKKAKQGRRPKLTGSEKRKLTRLYMYTDLSTEDICEVLRRLCGKSISVRCAQNNIKEILHTNRLVSTRPRDRAECRLRTTNTRRFREISVAGKRRDNEGRSKERSYTRSPSRLPITDGLQIEPENEIPPCFSSFETPLYTSFIEDETDFNLSDIFDNTIPPERLADTPWNYGIEPGALAGAEDTYLGFPIIEYSSEPIKHALASLEPELEYETFNFSPNASPPEAPRPELFKAGLIADESIMDQYVNYPLETSNTLDDHSSWSAYAERNSAPKTSEGLEPPYLQDFRRADTGIVSIGVAQALESPHSQTASISIRISQDPQRHVIKRTPRLGTLPESDTAEIESKRRKSWSPSLESFTKRLSHSSSRISGIIAAFKHFSLSSKETQRSSAIESSVGSLNEIPWSGPQELTLETIYTIEYPVKLPGGFLEYDADGCTLSSWCPECLKLLDSCFGATGSHNTRPKYPIEGNRGLHCPGDLRPDRFNNTTLHTAAAIGACYISLIGIIERGCDLNAVNTAGQTFLHVLDPRNLLERENHLHALLSHVSRLGFDFGKVDHQGVNVLQALLQYGLHHTTVNRIFETLGDHILPGKILGDIPRDNLGRTWQSRLLHLAEAAKEGDPERFEALNALFWDVSGKHTVDFLGGLAFDEGPSASFDADHDELQRMVIQAWREPLTEDSFGRNCLHYLAGTHVEQPNTDSGHKQSKSTQKQSVSQHCQIRRSQCKRLLKAGVNPNAYDKAGNTPLLAFLHSGQTCTEGNDDGDIEYYVRALAKAGACVNSRNRRGESALHVAIKQGIISATRALIELGANLHARQQDGKGVVKLGLETAQRISAKMKVHKTLHIRIMACLNIARERGAVDDPTILQEWEAFQSYGKTYEQAWNGLPVRLPEHGLKLPAHVYDTRPISIEARRWLAKYPIDGHHAR